MNMTKDIIFICGTEHSEWCWNENFIGYFKGKGYNTHIHVLSNGHTDVDESLKRLKNIIVNIDSKFILVTHSMGNLIVNEFLNRNQLFPSALILLSPYPTNHRILSAIRIAYSYYTTSKEELLFSNRINNCEKYIKLLSKESPNIRKLTLTYSKPNVLKFAIPTYIMGSDNDKCIPVKSLVNTMKFYGATLKIYRDICHDSMLDPDWEKIAFDIYRYLENK